MAIATEDFIKQIDEMSVLELNGLVKALEEHYGVSAAAAAAPAAGRRRGGGGCAGRGADRVRRRADRDRRQEDQRHQGGPRGDQSRPQGRQGAGRVRAGDRQGGGLQGRGGGDQEEVRRSWSAGRAQVGHDSRAFSGETTADQHGGFTGVARRPATARAAGRRVSPATPRRGRYESSNTRQDSNMARKTRIPTRERTNFSRIETSLPIPNLIDVQRRSYERFLQMNLLPEERENHGLQAVFNGIFPFSDFRETCSLDFVQATRSATGSAGAASCKGLEYLRMTCTNCGSKIMTDHPHEETVDCAECGVVNKNRVTRCDTCGNPVDLQLKYSISECQERGMTHAVPLRVTFRLVRLRQGPRDRRADDARRQGGGGLLRRHPADDRQRHVRHQRHRAGHRQPAAPQPRASSSPTRGRAPSCAKIIPYRGSWVEFEYDQKEVLNVRIDRKRKFHGTVFLRALGLESDEAILRQFYVPVPVPSRTARTALELSLPPAVLERERLRDRHAAAAATIYRIFAGIELDRRRAGQASKPAATPRSPSVSSATRPRPVHRRRRRPGHRRGAVRGQRRDARGPERRRSRTASTRRSSCSSPTGTCAARCCRTPWPRTPPPTPRRR